VTHGRISTSKMVICAKIR